MFRLFDFFFFGADEKLRAPGGSGFSLGVAAEPPNSTLFCAPVVEFTATRLKKNRIQSNPYKTKIDFKATLIKKNRN